MFLPSQRNPTRRRDRRGSLYVAVLGVTLIVSMIALSAMHVARLQLQATEASGDRRKARLLAFSALELAVLELNENANWRTDYALNTEYPATPVAAGGGSFTWRLIDLGGGQLRLDGIGRVGSAQCVMSGDLAQRPSLDSALLVNGNLTVGGTEALTVQDAGAVSHATISNSGTITGNVEAATFAGAGTYSGLQTALTSNRILPGSEVFDYYLSVGTSIAPPANGEYREIADCVLSPSSNPYGAANADGVYVIDATGYSVKIMDCRIVGTLIITNIADDKHVMIKKAINWEPAYSNYPAILVDGDVVIELSNEVVDESEVGIPNLNPAGTPWQGQTDTDADDDTYLSALAGIVYCSGDLTFDGLNQDRAPDLQGLVIVGGACTINYQSKPVIKYLGEFAALPPPGFGDGQLYGPSQIKAHVPSSPSNDKVLFDKWWGQFVDHGLPVDTVMWRVTKLEVRVRKYASGSGGTLHVVTYTNKSNGKPDVMIEDVAIPYASLPDAFGWVEVPSSAGWMPASQDLCVCLEARNSDQPAELEYSGSGVSDAPSGMLRGDGATWDLPLTTKSIAYRIEAEYTTSTTPSVAIRAGSLRQTAGP